jgi:hypothetical protein
VSAAAAAAVEVPLLAAVWLGMADGARLVGVAFLDSANRSVSAHMCLVIVICLLLSFFTARQHTSSSHHASTSPHTHPTSCDLPTPTHRHAGAWVHVSCLMTTTFVPLRRC